MQRQAPLSSQTGNTRRVSVLQNRPEEVKTDFKSEATKQTSLLQVDCGGWLVGAPQSPPFFCVTADPLIDAASAPRRHIRRSFISHQSPLLHPEQRRQKLNKHGNVCWHIYLFSLSKHFLQALPAEPRSLEAITSALVIFRRRNTEVLKRRPKRPALTGGTQRRGSTPPVCGCIKKTPRVCMFVHVRIGTTLAEHNMLGCESADWMDQNAGLPQRDFNPRVTEIFWPGTPSRFGRSWFPTNTCRRAVTSTAGGSEQQQLRFFPSFDEAFIFLKGEQKGSNCCICLQRGLKKTFL